MGSVLVDNEWLAIEQPEGFDPIPHDELEALMGVKYDCMWGMRDRGRRMVVSVTWKDSGGLLTKLMNEKALAKRVDEAFAKRYRGGGYRRTGSFDRTVAGASGQAHGFGFSYMIEGVAHEGEVLVFKRGTRCYTLYYYTSADAAADNRAAFEGILESLEVR